MTSFQTKCQVTHCRRWEYNEQDTKLAKAVSNFDYQTTTPALYSIYSVDYLHPNNQSLVVNDIMAFSGISRFSCGRCYFCEEYPVGSIFTCYISGNGFISDSSFRHLFVSSIILGQSLIICLIAYMAWRTNELYGLGELYYRNTVKTYYTEVTLREHQLMQLFQLDKAVKNGVSMYTTVIPTQEELQQDKKLGPKYKQIMKYHVMYRQLCNNDFYNLNREQFQVAHQNLVKLAEFIFK